MKGHDRMSTQDLLLAISDAVEKGETKFEIAAAGQHDIGGPLWNKEGKTLHFHVTNPGQRLGSMCLPGTEIVCDGSTSADVGWLNAGGIITVRGDAGDTAGHCSSGGKIYIGGRGGTRTGSLMKHDPLYEEPELWILKNVGSFSFEFMGGGRAIVCGYDSKQFASVLGERACVGMVGGVVYVRGPIDTYPADVICTDLDEDDIKFIDGGMADFLKAVARPEIRQELSDWSQWHKLRPLTFEEKKQHEQPKPDLHEFRTREWVKGGIFSDVAMDDFAVKNLIENGDYRLRVPSWDNAKYASPCEYNCPTGIPTQRRYKLLREGKTAEAYQLELEYTPFPGSVCGSVCPNPCMDSCTRGKIDEPIQIGALGFQSVYIEAAKPGKKTGKKIGIIGGGVAGLSAAWQLIRKGHDVTVYDDAEHIGGKLEQVIPRGRLSHELLEHELKRIEDMGVKFVSKCRVDKAGFAKIRQDNDAVIVATGGHQPRFFDWEGKERLTMGLDFLKKVNRGEHPSVGKHVVVIGCGNSGMDTCRGAYEMGAESVVAIDVQKPAAFADEIAYIKSLGGKLVWPFMTTKIDAKGIYANDGQFIPADQVIVSIGEAPILDYLPDDDSIKKFRGSWLIPDKAKQILPGVFAAGDVIKPGRLTDAIGDAIKAAWYADEFVQGQELAAFPQKEQIPAERLSRAWFDKCKHCDLPEPCDDHERCVSCGTCRDCKMCLESCPEQAITRVEKEDGTWEYQSDAAKCIGCGICAGVCPCGVWTLKDNPDKIKMYRTYNK
jgi:NADPH-dependent glutamate synthase beta subunit-like oxidoreductase/glutamate synthase domain-containing protein 3/ferredoxin